MGIDWQLNLNEIISDCYIVGGLGIRGILLFLYLEHMWNLLIRTISVLILIIMWETVVIVLYKTDPPVPQSVLILAI